jgi:hypothetical protein
MDHRTKCNVIAYYSEELHKIFTELVYIMAKMGPLQWILLQ